MIPWRRTRASESLQNTVRGSVLRNRRSALSLPCTRIAYSHGIRISFLGLGGSKYGGRTRASACYKSHGQYVFQVFFSTFSSYLCFLEEVTISDILRLKRPCKEFQKSLEFFIDIYYNWRLCRLLSYLGEFCEEDTENNDNQCGEYPLGVSGIYTAPLISTITHYRFCALKQGHMWYNINFWMDLSKWHQFCDMNRQRRSGGA